MRVEPVARLDGHFAVPGDKSVSHRSLLLGAISDGETVVRGFGRSGDTLSTHGAGLRGLQGAEIDCGNAGTLVRLIAGLLAFQHGTFTLTGDESLSSRPMERIAE